MVENKFQTIKENEMAKRIKKCKKGKWSEEYKVKVTVKPIKKKKRK